MASVEFSFDSQEQHIEPESPNPAGATYDRLRERGSCHGGDLSHTHVPVTVLIVNWNRQDYLSATLKNLRRQRTPSVEILVVDNGSTDGAPDVVEAEFPEVRLIRLPINLGHCAGLNIGLESARSDIVISLDNDAVLEDGSVDRILRKFHDRPNLAVLHGKIVDYDTRDEVWWWDWYGLDRHTYAQREFPTPWKIAEGLCALRRKAVLSAGGFAEEYFIMEAGRDLAIRLIEAGHDIIYTPEITFYHKSSLERGKTDLFRLHSDRRMYFKLRNELWTIWKYYPMHLMVARTLFKMATWGVIMAGRGSIACYFRAIIDAFKGIPIVAGKRKVVRGETIAKVEYSRIHARHRLREVLSWYFSFSKPAPKSESVLIVD